MSDIPEDIMQAAKLAVAEWLNEQEGFSSRWERVPDSVEPWLETAWALATVAERERDLWLPIDSAPRDGTRFLAAEWDGQGWVIGPCLWCKTPHVPLYGFHFTEGDPENWEFANPKFWQPLPTIRSPERAGE